MHSTHTHTHTRTRTPMHTHEHTHTHTDALTHTRMHASTPTYMHAHIHDSRAIMCSLTQDPAFLKRLEAMMEDSDSDDDDVVHGQGGLLSQLPGGERINHKELEDMEDIDW